MIYDVVIMGGGLAGLSLALDLKQRGHQVAVVEKGNYPRHKVCGEYISLESRDYLYTLCPALNALELPLISRFKLTTGADKQFSTPLALGGFGVSRYLLEELLFEEAKRKGVIFYLNTRALQIHPGGERTLHTVHTSGPDLEARLVCNASGRKSNLEAKHPPEKQGTNYVGIKYHVRLERDVKQIEIHNFPGGYCGISAIEEGKSCLCYLANAAYLKRAGNSVSELEKTVLSKNAQLKKILSAAEFLTQEPLTISGVNFRIKQAVDPDSLFLGDSAGSIAPITGNGMSIALRSAFVLGQLISLYLSGQRSQQALMREYNDFWNREFSARIRLSRGFQKLSEFPFLTALTIRTFRLIPALAKTVIRQTHGKPF